MPASSFIKGKGVEQQSDPTSPVSTGGVPHQSPHHSLQRWAGSNKGMILLVGFSAAFTAGTAGYFSIYGISLLFAGAFWSAMVMGIALEVAKFVSVTFLHWYWKEVKWLMKLYMLTAIVVLMVITSIGIYGFLSNAYQKTSIQLEKMQGGLGLAEEAKKRLEDRKQAIAEEIKAVPANLQTSKRKLIVSYEPEIKDINIQLVKVYEEIRSSRQEMVGTAADVGPIIFIARAFGTGVDDVVKYLIFAFILVFDPLAVCLVLALNFTVQRERERWEDIDLCT